VLVTCLLGVMSWPGRRPANDVTEDIARITMKAWVVLGASVASLLGPMYCDRDATEGKTRAWSCICADALQRAKHTAQPLLL
jgi:hypothetical protein